MKGRTEVEQEQSQDWRVRRGPFFVVVAAVVVGGRTLAFGGEESEKEGGKKGGGVFSPVIKKNASLPFDTPPIFDLYE